MSTARWARAFLGGVLACLLVSPGWVSAQPAPLAQAITDLGARSRAAISAAVERLGALDDPAALPALEALRDRRLRADDEGGRVLILDADGTAARDAVTMQAVPLEGLKLRTPIINNAVRRALLPVIAKLQLRSPDPQVRLAAAEELATRPREDAVETMRAVLDKESDAGVRTALQLALARIQLESHDPATRRAAVETLGAAQDIRVKSLLLPLVAQREDGSFQEPDEAVRTAAHAALASIERHEFVVRQAGNLFYGVSLGSVLLLAALGLAITFGLMGVINMAHGEMLMLGAYATYVTQGVFRSHLPQLFDWYLLAALPVAFAVSALVGMILERTVIRHLYGRPLETLLATWGLSLILIQSVRLLFGAQNVQVANPDWLSGGVEVLQGLVLPYSRIAIVLFVVLVVFLVWATLARTRLGLEVRAVTQNRAMAGALGISTGRVDMLTFGLGSGVAGLGGVALSQLGNVGPELGQSYIVDCFMVVVLGGVGKIAGTVAGALGLGVVNKFLEPVAGAVLGKILVLAFIILFIQKRPQGIFALRGRAAEA